MTDQVTYAAATKQPHESDLGLARRAVGDLHSALTEVLYVLESKDVGKEAGVNWCKEAMACQAVVSAYLEQLQQNVNKHLEYILAKVQAVTHPAPVEPFAEIWPPYITRDPGGAEGGP